MVNADDFICGKHTHMSWKTCHNNFAGIFVSGTYMAMTCEVDDALDCVWYLYAPILYIYAHSLRGKCDLYLQVAAICLVIYASNMKCIL